MSGWHRGHVEHHPRPRSRGFGLHRSRSCSSSRSSSRSPDPAPARGEDHSAGPAHGPPLPSGTTVKVYPRANAEYNLTVRNNVVVLSPANLSDDNQLWIRDDTWSTRVKDDVGHGSFALINKATGKALQHAKASGQQVRLADYHPGTLDENVLWTLSDDIYNGYKAIRQANDTGLNLDAWKADASNGGVHDGTLVCVYKWNKQNNQQWKVVPV